MASRETNLADDTPDATLLLHHRLSDPFDDMHDDPAGAPSPLSSQICAPILDHFDPVDKAARTSRGIYEIFAVATAVFGASAVLLAILELGREYLEHEIPFRLSPETILVRRELLAVIAMLVSWAIMWVQKSRWLARRHQAERYRQIKYQLLVRPEKWTDGQWLAEELKPVQEFDPGFYPPRTVKRLEHAIEYDAPRVPFAMEKTGLPRGDLQRLVNYYLEKRLTPQREYLDNRTRRNRRWNAVFNGLEILLSFGVLAALGHAAWIRLNNPSRAAVFLLAAACFPVLAAYVRTLRASFEFSRNKTRFRAAHAGLLKLEESLKTDLGAITSHSDQDSIDAHEILKKLHWSEHILTTEHIEWLRLMIETEFFG